MLVKKGPLSRGTTSALTTVRLLVDWDSKTLGEFVGECAIRPCLRDGFLGYAVAPNPT